MGKTDLLPGVYDGVNFNIIGMKESKWVAKYMATYGSLSEGVSEKEERWYLQDGTHLRFKLVEPLLDHKMEKHSIDDHNHLRQQVPSLEGTWTTSWWPNKVFASIYRTNSISCLVCYDYG